MLARFIARAASAQDAAQVSGNGPAATPNVKRLPLRPGAKWLELGAGTGIVGLAAAVSGGCSVTLTDIPAALDLLTRNAEANAEAVAARGGAVRVAAYQWCERPEVSFREGSTLLFGRQPSRDPPTPAATLPQGGGGPSRKCGGAPMGWRFRERLRVQPCRGACVLAGAAPGDGMCRAPHPSRQSVVAPVQRVLPGNLRVIEFRSTIIRRLRRRTR